MNYKSPICPLHHFDSEKGRTLCTFFCVEGLVTVNDLTHFHERLTCITHQSPCSLLKRYVTPWRHSSLICVALTQWCIIRRQQTILCTPVTLVKKHLKGRMGSPCLYALQMGYAVPIEWQKKTLAPWTGTYSRRQDDVDRCKGRSKWTEVSLTTVFRISLSDLSKHIVVRWDIDTAW